MLHTFEEERIPLLIRSNGIKLDTGAPVFICKIKITVNVKRKKKFIISLANATIYLKNSPSAAESCGDLQMMKNFVIFLLFSCAQGQNRAHMTTLPDLFCWFNW